MILYVERRKKKIRGIEGWEEKLDRKKRSHLDGNL